MKANKEYNERIIKRLTNALAGAEEVEFNERIEVVEMPIDDGLCAHPNGTRFFTLMVKGEE